MPYKIQENKEELNAALQERGATTRVFNIVANKSSKYRYIQFCANYSPNSNEVHYEYYSNGFLYLHFEPLDKTQGIGIERLANFLKDNTIDHPQIAWKDRKWVITIPNARWVTRINQQSELIEYLAQMESLFKPLIKTYVERVAIEDLADPYLRDETYAALPLEVLNDDVSAFHIHLGELMRWNISLPDYQRDYCWENTEIVKLWNALKSSSLQYDYHLGTVILHRRQDPHSEQADCFDIIDGQQRLVTLTLMLRALGADTQLPLLKHSFYSEESTRHVSNAKYVIKALTSRESNPLVFAQKMLGKLSFSVLILSSNNMDLAYTFFSAQNSRGVPLTDYDLLKAHHLRYINIEEQAMHLAEKWNAMTQEQGKHGRENHLTQTLAVHLYRLRHWMRKKQVHEDAPRHVQKEYQAAPVMIGIPPFCEAFLFNEKIQGGSHFFAYTDTFVHAYEDFRQTKHAELLDQYLNWGAHTRYASVIETLLFGYYLKHARAYMTEALFCICSIMAKHRYSTPRATTESVREYARNSELTMMVNQASSPTFFLAEALEQTVPCIFRMQEEVARPVQRKFHESLTYLFTDLPAASDKEIAKRIQDEYKR